MREHYRSFSTCEGLVGFARAKRHDNRIVVSGTALTGPDGETVGIEAEAEVSR